MAISILLLVAKKTTSPEPPLSAEAVFSMVNFYRNEKQIKPLIWDNRLCEYGKIRIPQIVLDWSHSGFLYDGGLEDEYCPECENFAENLARNQKTNPQIIQDWKNSPGHNGALLNSKWDIACIVIEVKGGRSFTVLEFGDIDGK